MTTVNVRFVGTQMQQLRNWNQPTMSASFVARRWSPAARNSPAITSSTPRVCGHGSSVSRHVPPVGWTCSTAALQLGLPKPGDNNSREEWVMAEVDNRGLKVGSVGWVDSVGCS